MARELYQVGAGECWVADLAVGAQPRSMRKLM